MKFIDLNIDEYCGTHSPKLSRILDCIDSEMRIRGCGACLADLFQCAVSDNSKENVRKFLLNWQSMAIHMESEVFNQYSEPEMNSLFQKHEKLYQKVYRYAGVKIPDDFSFVWHCKLIGCTSLITYPASYIDVEYFTNETSLPLDILEILHRDGLRLKDIEEQTEEYCKAAISNNGLALQYVKDKTDALCRQAVGMNGDALEFCPTQTEELSLRAVRQKGKALRHVKKQTQKVLIAALEDDAGALQYVKEQTEELCLIAVNTNGMALQYVNVQTYRLCRAAVISCGFALQFVREQTSEICLLAVKSKGRALEFVQKKTPQICIAAVCQTSDALQFVPDDIRPKIPQNISKVKRYMIDSQGAIQ